MTICFQSLWRCHRPLYKNGVGKTVLRLASWVKICAYSLAGFKQHSGTILLSAVNRHLYEQACE